MIIHIFISAFSCLSLGRFPRLNRSRRQATRSVRVRLLLGQASSLDLGLGRCSIP